MATTDRLTITKIEESQADKEVTANTAFDKLDKSIAGELVHDMASDADYTLVTTDVGGNENLNAVLHITDTTPSLTATRNIIVPTLDKLYIAINATAQSLVFKTAAGSGVTVATGDEKFVRCDGTNVVAITLAASISYASSAEINTGTETAKTVNPDALAGSHLGEKGFCVPSFGSGTNVATGNGTLSFCVPASMGNMDIVSCVASVHTAGTTGTTDTQIRRRRAAADTDVLSTKLTIDSGETSSTTAATPYVINAANDDLNEGDMIYIDVDAVSTTAPKGLSVTIMAQLP